MRRMVMAHRMLIAGSRKADIRMVTYAKALVKWAKDSNVTIVVRDNPEGVDQAVIEACRELGVDTICAGIAEKPRNGGHGKYIRVKGDYSERDRQMAQACNRAIYIWNCDSPGTKKGYEYAKSIGREAAMMEFVPLKKLYTMGYTGRSIEDLRKAVHGLGAYLADIRFSPVSRNPIWNGDNLSNEFGLLYKHVKDLGNKNYSNPEKPHVLVDAEFGLWDIEWMLTVAPVILLCACEDAHTCHRTTAATMIAERLGCEVEEITDINGIPAGIEQPTLF